MSLGEAIEKIDEIAEELIGEMSEARAEDLGLDPRSCYGTMFVSDEGIAVVKHNDRTLQYYGGFEYVDAEYRYEIGDYVFYSSEAGRVNSCIDCMSSEESTA
jgi:hypothetical protein